jgi:hypothetical protein
MHIFTEITEQINMREVDQLAQVRVNGAFEIELFINDRTVYMMYNDNTYECNGSASVIQTLNSIIQSDGCAVVDVETYGNMPFTGSLDEFNELTWHDIKDTYSAIQFNVITL